jgi:ABC-type phosphate transport system auxiliary subunit
MTDDITKFESRFDVLQDQYAALREDVENMIAVLQDLIGEEE